MASFRKRSGGWRAEVFKLGVRDSQTFPTKAHAAAWATQREAEIMAAGNKGPSSSFTLKQAIEKYKSEVSPTKAGQRWEEIRLDKLISDLEFVGDQLGRITGDQVGAWRDRRLKEVAAPSVRREMTLLSSVFEQARREWKWCSSNPVKEIKRPTNNRPRDRRISSKEEQQLLAAMGYVEGVAPATLTQELAYLFLLALETAMRQGELLSLGKADVRLRERYARLDMTKNGDARDVPLSRRAVELLGILVDAAGSRESIFQLKSASADAMFRRIRGQLEIEGLRFHDTRHEAITRLARKLDVLDLARMTGHRDPRSLMGYYNATASEVASRLD
ncbi:Phage integrase family protein [compost metagenome]